MESSSGIERFKMARGDIANILHEIGETLTGILGITILLRFVQPPPLKADAEKDHTADLHDYRRVRGHRLHNGSPPN